MRRDNPADEALPFKLSLQGRQLVVAPAGDIDLTNAHMLTTAVLAAASETNPLSILIDLTDVTFFESAFLAAVIDCQQNLAVSGIGVKVCNPSEAARRVFEVTGLTHLLEATARLRLPDTDPAEPEERRNT